MNETVYNLPSGNLLLVIIAHILLLVHVLIPSRERTKPAPIVAEVQLKLGKRSEFEKRGDQTTTCSDSYIGVGIQHDWNDTVVDLAPDGPAERAGVRVGDNTLNRHVLGRDRFPAGTHLVLLVERLGKRLEFKLTTEVICEKPTTK